MTPLDKLRRIGIRHSCKSLIDEWIAEHVREVTEQTLDTDLTSAEDNAAEGLGIRVLQFAEVTDQDTPRKGIRTYRVWCIKGGA